MGVFKWLQRHLTNSTPWMDMFNTITVPQLRVEQFSVLPKFWLRSGKWRGGKNNDIGKVNNKDNILLKCKYMYLSQSVSSVTQSCLTLCDPMNHSTPGLPVNHQIPEFTQTHVHRVSDAIQPSHPQSSCSPPAPNPSQHQSLFQ